MKPNQMHSIAHRGTHGSRCAPKAWSDVPNVTGDYDLDATILHRGNKDLPHRLQLYTRRSAGGGAGTGYGGYRNYSRDD
jgi:hypothetical protein